MGPVGESWLVSEKDMRSKVLAALKPLHAVSVENYVGPGTPDVNYVEGWIELKWLQRWPKNANTVVTFDFPAQQRIWHLKRRSRGGRSWFLIQCKREWILMDGGVAAINIGFLCREDIYKLATETWTDLHQQELILCVSRPPSIFSFCADDWERVKAVLPTSMGGVESIM